MFQYPGRLAASHPWKIVAFWLLLAAALTALAPTGGAQTQDDDVRFLPPQYPIVRGLAVMEKAFPNDIAASRAIITVERADSRLSPADFDFAAGLAERLRQLRESEPSLAITNVAHFRDPVLGKRLVSEDGQCTLISVSLATPYLALQTRDSVNRIHALVKESLAEVAAGGAPTVHVSGPAGFGRDLIQAGSDSLSHTTWATVLLVVVVLMLVYRSPVLAMIPLLTIGLAVLVSVKVLALLTLIPGVQLVNVSQVFLVVILFGAGTDYCLFLISRFREELEMGQDAARSTQRAVRTVGGALAASAGTVMVGLGMMGFAEFGKIRGAGPVIALGLGIGALASLTLTPALLRLGKAHVFWPMKVRVRGEGSRRNGFWEAFSHWVVRHPGRTLALSVVPLVPLWYFGIQVEPGFKPIGDLSPNADSIRGLDTLQRHFTAGEVGPISVLLVAPKDWKSPEGRAVLDTLSRGFARLGDVAEVRSLTQPMGIPLGVGPVARTSAKPSGLDRLFKPGGEALGDSLVRQVAEGHYLSRYDEDGQARHVARLDLVLKGDPFDPRAVDALREVDTWLSTLLPAQADGFAPVRAELYGVTVHMRDMERVIHGDRQRVNLLVTLGVFLILLAVVRQFWLAAMLLGTVLLSYVATLGATSLFAAWLTGHPPGMIEWRVPFFLFTILIAIGEDYNILMISRIMQERKRRGMVEGIRRGLAATGGTITACGLIMAGTFATLMIADLSTLRQIGFALAFGVLLDTFLVRPMMVPALLLILRDDEGRQEGGPVSARSTSQPTMLKLFTAMSIPPMPEAESRR